MHELAVTQALLDLVLKHADAQGAMRVAGIHIQIGQLSSYVDEAVQFYWDMISADTLAEGAQLHFERIPMQLACRACGAQFAPEALSYQCPTCGSPEVDVIAGEEFQLVGLDIEKEPRSRGVETLP